VSLRIGTLTTRCRARRGQEAAGALVDTVARERMPYEIAARLGPSLDREAAVVRLRGLDVRVQIDTESLHRGALADVWASAVVRALHEALARPDEEGERLRRFDGRAAYLAAMIAALMTAAPRRAWQFPEIAERGIGPSAAEVVDLLVEAGPLLGEVMTELRRLRVLNAALVLLDEIRLERLIRAAASVDGGDGALDLDQLQLIAATLVETAAAPRSGAAASRRQAVQLWLQLHRRLPLRGIWNALRLLLQILEQPSLLAGASQPAELPDGMPPWCGAVLDSLRRGRSAQTAALLEQLRQITPTAVAVKPGKPEDWLESECAGVLLLCDTIRRLGWMRLLRDAGHDARVTQAILLGIGMRLIAGRPPSLLWEPGQPIEPAVALLGGLLQNPEARSIGRVFAETSPDALAAFTPGGDWQAVLDQACDALAAAFAARIRGFRNAKRGSVTRHFLRRPGRILIEETRLRVVLKPSPFAVALHISGADAPVDYVEWLGGRRVEFVLEGL
jgi:hypothetical protein